MFPGDNVIVIPDENNPKEKEKKEQDLRKKIEKDLRKQIENEISEKLYREQKIETNKNQGELKNIEIKEEIKQVGSMIIKFVVKPLCTHVSREIIE